MTRSPLRICKGQLIDDEGQLIYCYGYLKRIYYRDKKAWVPLGYWCKVCNNTIIDLTSRDAK